MNIFIFHSDTTPRVCVYGEQTPTEVKIQVARCGVKDQYNKARGRAITQGRMSKHGPLISIPIDQSDLINKTRRVMIKDTVIGEDDQIIEEAQFAEEQIEILRSEKWLSIATDVAAICSPTMDYKKMLTNSTVGELEPIPTI